MSEDYFKITEGDLAIYTMSHNTIYTFSLNF